MVGCGCKLYWFVMLAIRCGILGFGYRLALVGWFSFVVVMVVLRGLVGFDCCFVVGVLGLEVALLCWFSVCVGLRICLDLS